MERKITASISISSLLYVARRIGTEDFPVMSHCVYEQGCDAVEKGNISRSSSMKSVHSFQPGTAASYPQNRAIRKENSLSLAALALFQRELLSAGRSRCYCQWGGRRGWKHSSQEKQLLTLWTPHSRLSHRLLFPNRYLMLCKMSFRHRNIFSLLSSFFFSKRMPLGRVVPLRQ